MPFNQVDMANVGLNGGYAYTFVWDKRLYLSLSSVVGISAGYHRVHSSGLSTTSSSGLSLGVNHLNRLSIGYNSNAIYAGMSLIWFAMNNRTGNPGDWITYSTGHIRFNLVKRFSLKKPVRFLRPDLWTF
jgi:hypothetical protein